MLLQLFSLALAAYPAAVAALVHRDGDSPRFPYDPKTNPYCTYWYDNDGAKSCEEVVEANFITMDDFLSWNPSLTANCGNFQKGRSYCVETFADPNQTTSMSLTTSTPVPTTTTTTTTTTKPWNGITTPTPVQPDMVDNCDKFYFVKRGEICADIAAAHGISVDEFASWNPKVGKQCSGLWADTYACVSIVGHEGTPTTPSNGVQTPKPVMPEMINACKKFHYVRRGQYCDSIAAENGITTADFISWNPKVGSDCRGLWLDVNVCVGIIGSYDFNEGSTSSFSFPPGAYEASSRALVASKPGSRAIINAVLTDFVIAADITLPSYDGNAGLAFRISEHDPASSGYRGYYAGISATNGGYITLGHEDKGWRDIRYEAYGFRPGTTYRLKVRALGDEIAVFVDDMLNPKFTVRDGATRSGVCGARVWSTGATFDNIEMAPVVYDNFDQNMVGWAIVDGGFDAASGELVVSHARSGKAVLSTTFQDFVMEADIVLPNANGGNAGFIFRASELGSGPDIYHGYYAGLTTLGEVMFGRADGGWRQLKGVSMKVTAGNRYHMKISAVGDLIEVFVDDMNNAKISIRDSTHGRGFTGVRVWETSSKVDNYMVRGL